MCGAHLGPWHGRTIQPDTGVTEERQRAGTPHGSLPADPILETCEDTMIAHYRTSYHSKLPHIRYGCEQTDHSCTGAAVCAGRGRPSGPRGCPVEGGGGGAGGSQAALGILQEPHAQARRLDVEHDERLDEVEDGDAD